MDTAHLREQLKARSLKTATVEVADYGALEIRELTARQRLTLATQAAADGRAQPEPAQMAEIVLLAAAYGLGLTGTDLELLDNHPDLVQEVGTAVLELSGLRQKNGSGPNL